MISNNKFIGYFKTENEYRPHECLILTYAIPLDKEGNLYDYENTLLVDLTTMSESSADYLRSMAESNEAQSHKTFSEFASTRIFSGRQETILNYLFTSGYILKVPSNQVMLVMGAVGAERNVWVSEINAQIRETLAAKPAASEDVSSAVSMLSETVQAKTPVPESVPFIERVPEYHTPVTSQPRLIEKDQTPSLREEVASLNAKVTQLTEMLEKALAPKKAGRPPKPKQEG